MAYTVESLVRVAMAGGSLVVGEGYTVESLVRIAMALKVKGRGTLTIKAGNTPVESMVRVAMIAPGQVIFDVA